MTHDQVIVAPKITEKSFNAIQHENKYTFEVHRDAHKIQVRQAIEALFGVTVEKVNIMNVPAKQTRRTRTGRQGHRPAWRKAVVTLAPGQTIEGFEG